MKALLTHITLILIIGSFSYGQGDCSKKLKEAQLMLDRGDLYDIPNKLETCIDNGFSKEEKIKAYALMSEAYLYLGQSEKANKAYLDLLKLKPLYKPYEDDVVEVHEFHEKFTTKPHFNFPNVKLGFNRTYVSVINDYSLNASEDNEEQYQSKNGLEFGLGGDINFKKGVYFTAFLMYSQKRFSYSSTLLKDHTMSFSEYQQWLEVPLGISYSPSNWQSKLTPYVSGSFVLGFLIRSSAVELRRENVNPAIDEKAITGPDISLTAPENNQRKRNYNFMKFTLGAKYRINEKFIAFDVSYQMGLRNLLREENQYNNQEMIYKYGYVDDDFRLNDLSFSLTFINPLYAPRIKKEFKKNVD